MKRILTSHILAWTGAALLGMLHVGSSLAHTEAALPIHPLDDTIPLPQPGEIPVGFFARSLENTQAFTLTDIDIRGNSVVTDETLRAIYAPHLGKTITLGRLHALSDAITKTYRNQGYLLSFAYVPQQYIRNGRPQIQIIEGKISDIKIDGDTQGITSEIASLSKSITNTAIAHDGTVSNTLLSLQALASRIEEISIEPLDTMENNCLRIKVHSNSHYSMPRSTSASNTLAFWDAPANLHYSVTLPTYIQAAPVVELAGITPTDPYRQRNTAHTVQAKALATASITEVKTEKPTKEEKAATAEHTHHTMPHGSSDATMTPKSQPLAQHIHSRERNGFYGRYSFSGRLPGEQNANQRTYRLAIESPKPFLKEADPQIITNDDPISLLLSLKKRF